MRQEIHKSHEPDMAFIIKKGVLKIRAGESSILCDDPPQLAQRIMDVINIPALTGISFGDVRSFLLRNKNMKSRRIIGKRGLKISENFNACFFIYSGEITLEEVCEFGESIESKEALWGSRIINQGEDREVWIIYN